MCSEKTIYNYIDYSLFNARNINLPRKVTFKPRKSKAKNFKVDKACRISRTYEDFLTFLKETPDTPVVELDSVVGPTSGKVLLTIHFTDSLFMVSFLREANTSQSVIDVFDRFYWELGPDTFRRLFPVLLCDNGSEFSNPSAIEFDKEGNRRTYIFYCDPSAPYQKGAAENNHEFIRRVIPKGTSFNDYEQSDINLMMSHINSYGRKKLNDRSPYSVFSFLHGYDLLKLVEYDNIPSPDIILLPRLLKK
jgi:IS30 family transposase